MHINGLKQKIKPKNPLDINTNIKLKFSLSPKNTSINSLKQKYIRFSKLPKTLSNNLTNKIIKESLILSLREELQYNEKIESIFQNYLTKLISLKLQVKKNKEEVESNCEKLKNEFHEKFIIVDNFEKQIGLLNDSKKEIIRTNEEIINLKNEQNNLLRKQFDKVQDDCNKQMDEISKLKNKIDELTEIKNNIQSELEKELEIEEQKHKVLLKEYALLVRKCEYYQIEYDKFDMFPEEKIKKELNLYDNTYSNDLITEENLKIKLYEKKSIRDELINNKESIKEKIDNLEETQKEILMREKKYGKNLDVRNNVKFRKHVNKKLDINLKYSNIGNNFSGSGTIKNSDSIKRIKTYTNKKNIMF